MSDDSVYDYLGKGGSPQAPRATNGGYCEPKPTSYSPPKGPTNINDPKSPGLHGTNHGNKVNQGKH